jgi:DNA-binding XRE family transcriptional regulator
MLEPTKKPPIEAVSEIRFIGPRDKLERLSALARELGLRQTGETVPWRELFPQWDDSSLPGVCLAGARHKEGLTQRELAARTGIAQRHISEMENGKRAIGRETAKRLAEALGVSYKIFL